MSLLKEHKILEINGFTLVEILVVLAIISFVLLFNYSIAMTLSKGFVNSSSSKALLEFIKTTKQLAVLNSENYNEYLMGMGVLFNKTANGSYDIKRVKYSIPGLHSYFNYVDPGSSPDDIIELPKDSYNFLHIPSQATLNFYSDDNHNPIPCNGNVLLIFSSLFGKPYIYCVFTSSITPVHIDSILKLSFKNTNNKIIINKNGEIYGTFK